MTSSRLGPETSISMRVSTVIGTPSDIARYTTTAMRSCSSTTRSRSPSHTPLPRQSGMGISLPSSVRFSNAVIAGTGSKPGRVIHSNRPLTRCVPGFRKIAGAFCLLATSMALPSTFTSSGQCLLLPGSNTQLSWYTRHTWPKVPLF